MLFPEVDRSDSGPPRHSEPQYSYLSRSARPEASRVRACLEAWFSHYPEGERPAFIAALQSRIDAQFIAAAYELYLHELLSRLGYEVEVHPANPTGKPGHPDFLAKHSTTDLYVEAVLATDMSDAERGAEARMAVVYDALNELGPTNFFLGMDLDGAPKNPPPAKRLRTQISKWLGGLDADAVAAAIQRNGRSEFPTFNFEHEGWRIRFSAIPKSEAKRGKPGVRPLAFWMFGARMVSPWKAIRDSILAKGSKYGELPAPLVVAVNVGGFPLDKVEVMQALFGQEQYFVPVADPNSEPKMERALNGVWTRPGGPRYRRISAVLISRDVHPWSMAAHSTSLYHNPWATRPCVGPICALPQCIPQGDKMTDVDGTHPREILGLPEGWPVTGE